MRGPAHSCGLGEVMEGLIGGFVLLFEIRELIVRWFLRKTFGSCLGVEVQPGSLNGLLT